MFCALLIPACCTSQHNYTRTVFFARKRRREWVKKKMKVGLICAVGGGQVIRGNSVVMLEVCFFGSWLG